MVTRVTVGSDSFPVDGNLSGNWTQFDPNFGNVVATSSELSKPPGLTGSVPAARWNAGSWAADQYAKIKLATYSGFNNFMEASVLVRGDGSDATRNFYFAYVYSHAGSVSGAFTILGKVVLGVYTELSNVTTDAWALNDTLELEVEGTTLRLMRNGVTLRSTTDTDIPGGSSTSAGTLGGGSVWEGGTLSSGAGGVFGSNFYRNIAGLGA